jgi:TfoX/Sxy family transcriptional regulator of competence genes
MRAKPPRLGSSLTWSGSDRPLLGVEWPPVGEPDQLRSSERPLPTWGTLDHLAEPRGARSYLKAMAYDESLAARVRRVLEGRTGVEERKMFGGLAFLLGGRMFCGILKEELMVRVGPERHAEALALPHARPMDFTGRPMTGMVYVAAAGLRGSALDRWVERGLEGLATTPVSRPKPRRRTAGAKVRRR